MQNIATFLLIAIFLLFILMVGGAVMEWLSGRDTVKTRLADLPDKKDRLGFEKRINGHTVKDVKTYWQILGLDEKVIELRLLKMDLVFPLIYGGTFLYSYHLASTLIIQSFPFATGVSLVVIAIFADWAEDLILIDQFKRSIHSDRHDTVSGQMNSGGKFGHPD